MKTPNNTADPSDILVGAMPDEPEGLYLLHRLCMRIYGLVSRDVREQAQELARLTGAHLRKKQRANLACTLEEELPILIALYTLDKLAADPRLAGEENGELFRSLLLPCFSLSYGRLYEEPADPLKHVLTRVDWYLDGDKGEALDAFALFVSTLMQDTLKDTEPLKAQLNGFFLPELDARIDLAFRYEFG